MQHINITENFPFPVEKLFSYLEKHENLETLFAPLNVKTIKDGNTEKYGVDSIRSLQFAIIPSFEETVTVYKKNELIEYKITKGSPLKNHYGIMKFSSTAEGSDLHYTIEFDSDIPFVAAIVKIGLENGIIKGLKKLKTTPL
ncbi:MAG: SRPBCC family protein [Chitinophagales bacterium]|nr:SRPBCC family protein [Chitinophagales bacterium]